MSKVFIAWSGNSNLATMLAKKINRTNSSYECVIGGNAQGNQSIYIGETIIRQMHQCDQAIVLIQKKKTGVISPNLIFEWGFLLSRLHSRKIHGYFIDMDQNDAEIPSDLQGIWADKFIDSKSKSIEKIAEEITADFFTKQRFAIEGNKMGIILDWDRTRRLICNHSREPVCSDCEIAQYALLYAYTGKIITTVFESVKNDLISLQNEMSKTTLNSELEIILKGAISTLNFLSKIKVNVLENGREALYLEADDYNDYFETIEHVLDKVRSIDNREIALLYKILLENLVVFMNLLMISNPNENDISYYIDTMLDYCDSIIHDCQSFICFNEPNNKQLVWLMLSYTYRSIYCGYCAQDNYLNLDTPDLLEQQKLKKVESLRKSLIYRRELYTYYKGENINGEFFDMIEMEYFLALAEYYKYEEDKKTKEAAKRRLRRYIERSNVISKNKKICIDIITEHMNEK